MNHKLKENKLIHGDIADPECTIAEFSDEVSKSYQKEMIASMNYGHEMLKTYSLYRNSMHISNVLSLIEKFESIWHKWNSEVYSANRNKDD